MDDFYFPKVQLLLEKIGYRFDRDMTEAEGDLMFQDNHSGRWLRFDDCREALGWIDGYVMLADNDNLLQIYEETMRSPTLPDYPELLQKALKLIDDFCLREYDSHSDPDEYRNLKQVPLAFTTCEEDEMIEVQAYADLVNYRIFTCLGEEEFQIRSEQYGSLKEMVDDVLPYLDFPELISVADYELADYCDFLKTKQLNDTLADAYGRAGNETPMGLDKGGPTME